MTRHTYIYPHISSTGTLWAMCAQWERLWELGWTGVVLLAHTGTHIQVGNMLGASSSATQGGHSSECPWDAAGEPWHRAKPAADAARVQVLTKNMDKVLRVCRRR